MPSPAASVHGYTCVTGAHTLLQQPTTAYLNMRSNVCDLGITFSGLQQHRLGWAATLGRLVHRSQPAGTLRHVPQVLNLCHMCTHQIQQQLWSQQSQSPPLCPAPPALKPYH